MKTTKEAVIKTTSDLADEKGLNNVSLKAVAQKLNIRTPSLYNHIESLDNLLLEVAHNGMREMNERMMKVAVGKIEKEAIKKTSLEDVTIAPTPTNVTPKEEKATSYKVTWTSDDDKKIEATVKKNKDVKIDEVN